MNDWYWPPLFKTQEDYNRYIDSMPVAYVEPKVVMADPRVTEAEGD